MSHSPLPHQLSAAVAVVPDVLRPEEPTLFSDSETGTGLPDALRGPPAAGFVLPAQATASPRTSDDGRALGHQGGAAGGSRPPERGGVVRRTAPGVTRLNEAPQEEAVAALLACCGSTRWAERVAAHRPYPDTAALLAAADEAAYDLAPEDVAEALADEYPAGPHPEAPHGPHVLMALAAAQDAYEERFGHTFVICLDGYRPDEQLDQILSDIRLRLAHEPDHEREVAAEQLRGVARSRLRQLAAGRAEPYPPPGGSAGGSAGGPTGGAVGAPEPAGALAPVAPVTPVNPVGPDR